MWETGVLSPAAPLSQQQQQQPDPQSRFGVNIEASTNFTQSLELARRAGFGENPADWIAFHCVCPEPVLANRLVST